MHVVFVSPAPQPPAVLHSLRLVVTLPMPRVQNPPHLSLRCPACRARLFFYSACYTFCMSIRGIVIGVVAFLLAVGTGYFVVARDPEDTFTQSADGVVTVSGKARASQPFAITSEPHEAARTVLGDTRYVLAPQDVYLDVPAVVTFRLDQLNLPAEAVTVYRYRPELLVWEPVLDTVTHTDEIIALETRELGVFALGTYETVAAPDFVSVYDALREQAPEHALGYTITVSYAREGEAPIRLLNVGEQGGCNGAVLPGEYEARSRDERTANVLVNDVQTTVTFSFLAQWFVADEQSCPEGMPFKPSSAYGILPTT